MGGLEWRTQECYIYRLKELCGSDQEYLELLTSQGRDPRLNQHRNSQFGMERNF